MKLPALQPGYVELNIVSVMSVFFLSQVYYQFLFGRRPSKANVQRGK